MNRDFITARYGDFSSIFLSFEEVERCEVRQRTTWRAMREIVETEQAEPRTLEVHSPRALPAFLGVAESGFTLIWDAGLGTLMDQLSTSMPHNQPPEVTEALLRRIVAVRCIIAGMRQQGMAQSTKATSLLKQTPIDRSYQVEVDAESQFEIFLITEMQEQFALAHELAHYTKAADKKAFDTFEKRIMGLLREAQYEHQDPGFLSRQGKDQSWPPETNMYDLGLDPYAWYLYDRVDEFAPVGKSCEVAKDIQASLRDYAGRSAFEREEIVCDLLAALSVALDAHKRQHGWTAAMGVACSRLALANVEALLDIDSWVANEGQREWQSAIKTTSRQAFMTAFLPVLIPHYLHQQGKDAIPQTGDLHSIMHMVENRYRQRTGIPLSKVDWQATDGVDTLRDDEYVLLSSTFFHLRPTPSHRTARRVAGRHKFELGVVLVSAQVASRSGDLEYGDAVEKALRRHQSGDWGELPDEDAEANNKGLFKEWEPRSTSLTERRDMLLSAYRIRGEVVFIRTNPDRSVTDIFLPQEY